MEVYIDCLSSSFFNYSITKHRSSYKCVLKNKNNRVLSYFSIERETNNILHFIQKILKIESFSIEDFDLPSSCDYCFFYDLESKEKRKGYATEIFKKFQTFFQMEYYSFVEKDNYSSIIWHVKNGFIPIKKEYENVICFHKK